MMPQGQGNMQQPLLPIYVSGAYYSYYHKPVTTSSLLSVSTDDLSLEFKV